MSERGGARDERERGWDRNEPSRDRLTMDWGRTGSGGVLAVQLHLDIAVVGVQRETHHARVCILTSESSKNSSETLFSLLNALFCVCCMR